jgi:hypothetical protein
MHMRTSNIYLCPVSCSSSGAGERQTGRIQRMHSKSTKLCACVQAIFTCDQSAVPLLVWARDKPVKSSECAEKLRNSAHAYKQYLPVSSQMFLFRCWRKTNRSDPARAQKINGTRQLDNCIVIVEECALAKQRVQRDPAHGIPLLPGLVTLYTVNKLTF